MAKPELYEVRISCDQGTIRAVSPLDIQSGDINSMGDPLVVHPGMGKAPERFAGLMKLAVQEGFAPVAFDTRWANPMRSSQGVSQQGLKRKELLARREAFGSETDLPPMPENWYGLRRVVALEQGIERLGIGNRSYAVHSEGARIATMAALRNPESTAQLVLVNPACAGDSWHAYKRLMRSNRDEIKAIFDKEVEALPLVMSGLSSVGYAIRGHYGVIQEKRVIQATNLWLLLDQLAPHDIPVSMLAAHSDQLVSFDTTAARAAEHLNVKFIPTEGRHTNVYTAAVQRLIINELVVNRAAISDTAQSA